MSLNSLGWFLGGNATGAILSVVADRILRHIERHRESRIKVRILGGYVSGIGDVEGINFTIRNLGTIPLPLYKIALFHPARGTLFVFEDSSSGPLLPDQERRHDVIFMRRGIPTDGIFRWLQHYKYQKIENPEGKGVLFRLKMVDSDKVLYENAVIGETLSNVIVASCRAGSIRMSMSEARDLTDTDAKYRREQAKLVASLQIRP